MFLILASGPCKSSFLSPAQELKIHHSPKVELFQHSAPRVLKRRKTQALCMLFDIPPPSLWIEFGGLPHQS